MKRIPASAVTRERLEQLFSGKSEVEDVKGAMVREAVRLIVEEALEGEVADALGRGYYETGAQPGAGYRNGYRTGKLKSAEGAIEYGVPQVADRAEPFRSTVRAIIKGRTAELERLAVEMYARGLSTRDIERAFTDEAGQSVLSKSAVSQVTEVLWQQYEAFAGRDLSEFKVLYLFVDGIAERLHLGQPREAVLCAWAILEDGKKALLHLAPGTKEDTVSCREFFRDLKARGLNDPILGSTDGAPGLSPAPSRNAGRRACASAAWRIGCVTSKPRCRPIAGASSSPRRGAATRRRVRSWPRCYAISWWPPGSAICPLR